MDEAQRWLEAISVVPEALLRRAMNAAMGDERAHYARLGLELEPLTGETELLLLRQLYRAQLEMNHLDQALETARRMTGFDTLRDVAHHDAARVLSALGDLEAAIRQQRAAARLAGPDRRSFQLWCLGTLEHFAARDDAALATLDRALRWGVSDRALIEAHRAYVEVARGRRPEKLSALLERLSRDGLRGYRLYLRGMIAYHQRSSDLAHLFLTRWLRRQDSADPAKLLTLHEELKRARHAVADLS